MQERTFPGTLDALEPIRKFVSEAAEAAGMDRSAIYNLCLAVDEIATNVVLHGYEEAGLSGEMSVSAAVGPENLVIRLLDHGKPYDPNYHDTPSGDDLSRPLEEREIGGLGILLALDGVDDLQYEVTDRGNEHRFFVQLKKSSR
ncbi:MAG TPA: ATP-binding protein [Nitrospiraceae bacterium]|nr:ATP-binding protein [Nitrospiraceae bacterium]